MIFDQYGLIVQNAPSYDGGDSCNRMGQYHTIIFALKHYNQYDKQDLPESTSAENRLTYLNLTDDKGLLRRHKAQIPWNNPWNCTRDQMNPMWISLALNGFKGELFEQFWNQIKRLGFYQSFERDYPGTRKSLLPTHWKKGQRYDDSTIIQKDTWIWKPDFADIAWLNDWNIFLRGFFHNSWLRFLAYPFVCFGDIFLALSVFSYVKAIEGGKFKEANQLNCAIVQTHFQIPTFISRWAVGTYFRRVTWSGICEQAENYWGGRGGYDSKKFAEIWILALYWIAKDHGLFKPRE